MRILLIEDDTRAGTALLESLSAAGHELSGANDGREAMAALGVPPPPEVLLLDPNVPHAQGPAFLQLLKQAFDAGVPVLVLQPRDVKLMCAPGKEPRGLAAAELVTLRHQVRDVLAALRGE